ncbi:PmbA [Pseudooceanicola batsensis HTCC2597]|uniref:PmbA n=1 Tax=Pseudooceanicola batsensis (strain ATCC BAA-863 / DSM 15984 / KCTC 12145 / HTCC2597) TaxID=252305 RepID=A3TW88_PSEBH|nr:TldD/PmbA family protein [Pseudooceanicola batsensis]EAQ03884.1 PmbA [Pseudooceanicola batsensis HTCC2597]
MTDTLEELTARLLDAARAAGADQADAMARDGTSISIGVRGQTLEDAERSEGVEIGLRAIVGQRQACVSSSDLRADAMREMAERAVAMARVAPEDPFVGLAGPDQLSEVRDAGALDLADPTEDPAPDDLQGDALAAEAAALAVAGVSQVQSAGAAYGRSRVYLAASNGFSGGYARTHRQLHCTAIAGTGTGMERDSDGDMRLHQSDLRTPEEIGRRAGERAVERLGPVQPKTGRYPVLFDERISGSLIGHLLAAVNGSAVARGASFLRDRLETRVLPEGLSLVEDPHRRRATGSRPFDAEGLRTARRAIVEDGVLTGWTLDLATARKLGMAPTANAARGLSSPPSPASWNVELTQGAATRDDLIAQMGTGFLVTSMIGSTINPNTGDYSRGASGFWVENGAISHPVSEGTIAGNLIEMLARIIPANDARTHLSHVVPSILIEDMSIAGQ